MTKPKRSHYGLLLALAVIVGSSSSSSAGPAPGNPETDLGKKPGRPEPEEPAWEQIELFASRAGGEVAERRPFQRVGVPTLDDRFWPCAGDPEKSPLIGYNAN